jgi:predicted nuclease of predicted toxin-antitoxin system
LPRFLLDENVPRSLGDELKRRGFAARVTTEALGAGLRNSDLVEVAQETGEIIVTFDADFLKLRPELQGLAKVLYIDMHPRDPHKAKMMLEKWLDDCVELLKQGNTVRLTETGPVLQAQHRQAER